MNHEILPPPPKLKKLRPKQDKLFDAFSNKITVLNRVAEICEKNNCDPFEVLCHIAMGDVEALGQDISAKPVSYHVRLLAAATLCPYLAPTFKTTELKDEGRMVNVTFNMGPPPE